jgi:hypothetical protein
MILKKASVFYNLFCKNYCRHSARIPIRYRGEFLKERLLKKRTVQYCQLSLCINVWLFIDKDINHLVADMKTQWWNNQCREGTKVRRPKLMVVVLLLSGTGLETGGGDDLSKTPSLYRLFS